MENELVLPLLAQKRELLPLSILVCMNSCWMLNFSGPASEYRWAAKSIPMLPWTGQMGNRLKKLNYFRNELCWRHFSIIILLKLSGYYKCDQSLNNNSVCLKCWKTEWWWWVSGVSPIQIPNLPRFRQKRIFLKNPKQSLFLNLELRDKQKDSKCWFSAKNYHNSHLPSFCA